MHSQAICEIKPQSGIKKVFAVYCRQWFKLRNTLYGQLAGEQSSFVFIFLTTVKKTSNKNSGKIHDNK